jgi:hypothetical protein
MLSRIFSVFKGSKQERQKQQALMFEKIIESEVRKIPDLKASEIRKIADLKNKSRDYLKSFAYYERLKVLSVKTIVPFLRQIEILNRAGNIAGVERVLGCLTEEQERTLDTHYSFRVIKECYASGKLEDRIEAGSGTVGATFEASQEAKNVPILIGEDVLMPAGKMDQFEGLCSLYTWGTTEFTYLPFLYSKYLKGSIVSRRIEFGFLGGDGLAAHGHEQRAIIATRDYVYYDARNRNDVVDRLNDETYKCSGLDVKTAQRCISLILEHKVSKYSVGSTRDYVMPENGRKNILVVDQRFGDKSLSKGMVSDGTFSSMLSFVDAEYSDYNCHVKIHPDASVPGLESAITSEVCEEIMSKYYIINNDVNPIDLVQDFDVVVVATSQLGFEAVISGKKVIVFGAPFYAGWGFTEDRGFVPHRKVSRSIEDVFFEYYINASRYYLNGRSVGLLPFLMSYN